MASDRLAEIEARWLAFPGDCSASDLMKDLRWLVERVRDMNRLVHDADIRSLRENQCVICTGHPYGTHYEGDCSLAPLAGASR